MTGFMVMGIIDTLERIKVLELRLAECERLKDAVRWERECRDTFAWLNNTLANVRADAEMLRSLIAARRAVEELL